MDFLRRVFLENFWLKVVAILLAFTLWLKVHRDPITEVAIQVPVEFHNIPPNLEISSDTVYRSTVRLRGPERAIHQLDASEVRAEIDLTGLHPGERTFDVTAEQIQHPRELAVVQIVPSEFHITFDAELKREVPVKPRIMGNFASGYEIGQVVVNPATVAISGPQKHVAAVDAAITDPIDVSGLMQQGSFVRHAYVSDPLIQVANPNPVRITVIMKQVQADSSAH
jgi:diadenylate cyclase